ncbi:hypothetical protein F5Y12DRAFT_718277 [Xylaria sp. FL1777]|nr:hypothetical protein F5Y12DRAFT_718277 [Xylaria sp. FL1777]
MAAAAGESTHFWEQWNLFGVQLNGYSRVIIINHNTFLGLGDAGQTFFKDRASEILGVPTEFILDGYNGHRVYLANPMDLQIQFHSQVVNIQGAELPVVFLAQNLNMAPPPQASIYPAQHVQAAYNTPSTNPSPTNSTFRDHSTPSSSTSSTSTGSTSSQKRKRAADDENSGQANTLPRNGQGRDGDGRQEDDNIHSARRNKRAKKSGDSEKKKVTNSFILFRNAHREQVKAKYLTLQKKNGQISRIIAYMWTAMTEVEQQPWYEEYDKLVLEENPLDPGSNGIAGTQKVRRRRSKNEEDRRRAVAVLQIIERQNANGEEIVFPDDDEIMLAIQAEDQSSGSSGNNDNNQEQGAVPPFEELDLDFGELGEQLGNEFDMNAYLSNDQPLPDWVNN